MALEDQLRKYAIGEHLTVVITPGPSINSTKEKGTLKSIDWKARSFVLHNTVYDHDVTIPFDKMGEVSSAKEHQDDMLFRF
jgi:DNA/RNA endonuclease G (NUC1)